MKPLLTAIFAGLLLYPRAVTAADPMAVVILTPAAGTPARCSPASEEPQVLLLYHPRIGGRNAVRLAPGPGEVISPAGFGKMKKVDLKDLQKLEMRDGLMMASGPVALIPRLSVPDRKPSATVTFERIYDTVFEGELREGNTEEPRYIPLKQVWKVYFVPEGSSADESLFAHATEERSLEQWRFYVKKVSLYQKVSFHRMGEVAERMILAANGCMDSAMKNFRDGNLSASETALDMARRLSVIVPDGADIGYIEARAAEVREAVRKVLDSIDMGTALAREQNWDAALGAWAPVRIFASDPALRNFSAAYALANRESYDLHVNAGANILASARGGGPHLADASLREALAHCEIAGSRLPEGEQGKACHAEAAIRLAISEALRLRTAGEPRAAGAILISMKGQRSGNADLDRTRGELAQEISRDLFSAARDLPGTQAQSALPPMSESEKTSFREAREMLLEAESLAHSPDAEKLLRSVNEALAKFHVDQGGKALASQQHGLALLHADAAGSFDPDNPDHASLRDRSRDAALKRSQVHVKVLFTDSSPKRSCKAFIDEFTRTAEVAIASIPNARTIDSRQTGRIRSAKSQGAKEGKPAGEEGINAVLSANIGVCDVLLEDHLQPVQSHYLSFMTRAMQAMDRYNSCAKKGGSCAQERSEAMQAQRMAPEGPSLVEQPYEYREGTLTVLRQIAFEVQIQDRSFQSISRPVEGNAVSYRTCFQRTGARLDDYRNDVEDQNPPYDQEFGFQLGVASEPNISDVGCSVNKRKELKKLVPQATIEIRTKSAEIVRALTFRHLENARLATDPDSATDHYALFLLGSTDPTGAEYREALDAIRARDPDFKPEWIALEQQTRNDK
jgi:hypothetical protein